MTDSEEISVEISLGHILREKRQTMKMELPEVSSYLKVKQRDVLAIEDGDLDAVTQHLYIPGLVRSYASLLRINSEFIEEKIKSLPIKSNVENKKHQLLNIGEHKELTPNKDSLYNFLLITVLLFLILLSLYHASADTSSALTIDKLINKMENIDSANGRY